MNILPLIQQQHSSQITYSFVSEFLGRYELQAFQLVKKIIYNITIFIIVDENIKKIFLHTIYQISSPQQTDSPAQSVLGSPAYAYKAALPHFCNGMYCLLL